MYFYISKKNLLKRCPKATEKELDILCALKEIDIDKYAWAWVDEHLSCDYRENITYNEDDSPLISDFIAQEINKDEDKKKST